MMLLLLLFLQDEPPGQRKDLKVGKLFVPEHLKKTEKVDVVVHFHGSSKVVEREFAKAKKNAILVTINLGTGSKVYTDGMKDPKALQAVLDEALGGAKLGRLWLSSFSAGYGAIREILKQSHDVAGIFMADSLYAGYVDKKPDPAQMEPFLKFAKSGKPMWLTHSAIVPGTYASTEETADYLISALGARREKADEKVRDMHLSSKADKGEFHVRGCDGATGDDHMKHLQNIGELYSKLP